VVVREVESRKHPVGKKGDRILSGAGATIPGGERCRKVKRKRASCLHREDGRQTREKPGQV